MIIIFLRSYPQLFKKIFQQMVMGKKIISIFEGERNLQLLSI